MLDAANARDCKGYAVFGHVISGMEVVDAIRTTATESKGMHQNLPVQAILVNKAIVEPKQ